MSDVDRDEFLRVADTVRETEGHVIRLQEQVSGMQKVIENLVTKAEFAPVKMIAYGVATAVGSTVLGAVLTLVIKQ